VPLLTNGAVTNSTNLNAFIFDAGYDVSYTSQMWGAEALILQDHYLPESGFSWQWAGGFRYLSYDEDIVQTGTYNAGGTIANRVTSIGSSSVNNIYGPEVGGRASVKNEYFTLSATPRIAFALNDSTSDITTDTGAVLSDDTIDFSPVLQLNMLAQLHVTSHFSLFGGYDFMWIYKTSRANQNIIYDSTPGPGGSFTPNIRQDIGLGSLDVSGFSMGAMFEY